MKPDLLRHGGSNNPLHSGRTKAEVEEAGALRPSAWEEAEELLPEWERGRAEDEEALLSLH